MEKSAASKQRRLLIIAGQEGSGKSTLARALLPFAQPGAAIDAEDLGQLNPWDWDDAFKNLLWDNVATIAHNFWRAGYANVIAGSFINDYPDYVQFRTRLDGDVLISLLHLCTAKSARDERRIARPKPTSKERRDDLDQHYLEDTTLQRAAADYRYIRLDNTSLSIAQSVDEIKRAVPEVFRSE